MNLHLRELRSGGGIPAVFLHGWLGCADDFQTIADDDRFAGRAVFGLELPGHGASTDPDREYDFEDVASWISDALPTPTVDLIGYSMGGRVALYFAGTQRDRVRRLALIAAHPGIEHPLDQRERLELDAQLATDMLVDPADFLEEWAQLELFGPATSPDWKAVRSRRKERVEAEAFGWSRALICLSTGRQLSLWNVPYGLDLPTLYAVGSKDEKYFEIAREFRAQNPDHVSIAIVGGAHHAAHLDQPEYLARRITEFLSD